MKAKPILMLVALIILVMLISFFLTQRSLKTAPLPQNISREEGAQILNGMAPQITRLPLKPAKRAITPIKKKALSQGIETISAVNEVKTQDTKETQKSALAAQVKAAATASSEEKLAADAGITQLSKRPTPEKIKELNSQGIIIY